jgi:large subunit ribosomal protein L24e
MAASREKQKAHRKKTVETIKASVKLQEPIQTKALKEKIKVPVKAMPTLVPGEGRSMGMEID